MYIWKEEGIVKSIDFHLEFGRYIFTIPNIDTSVIKIMGTCKVSCVGTRHPSG